MQVWALDLLGYAYSSRNLPEFLGNKQKGWTGEGKDNLAPGVTLATTHELYMDSLGR